METILQQMTEPAWWFSVVLVGLLISVAGTFLAQYAEKFFLQHKKNLSAKKQTVDKERQLLAQTLADNPTLFMVFMHFTQRVLTFTFATGLLTLLLLFFGTTVDWSATFKLIIIFMGFAMAIATAGLWSILNERLPVEFRAHRIYVEKFQNRVDEKIKKSAGE